MASETSAGGFSGTDRFQVLRRLGSGGMGVVYEVLDQDRDCHLALKTVRSGSGEDLLRLKTEFRALQDLHHPNLVSLGELLAQDDQWFFTMELVQGVDFLRYVRGQDASEAPTSAARPGARQRSTHKGGAGAASAPDDAGEPAHDQPPTGGYHETRLRQTLSQLAEGLAALHAAGRVHRDVKPSNVLVDASGRLVLLDFGLITATGAAERAASVHGIGTVEYMAPEQALGVEVGPAADWYSVGVMLFEALTGTVPLSGEPVQLMMAKQKHTPTPPSHRGVTVPHDLDALCVALLQPQPEARPGASEVLRRLQGETAAPAVAPPQPPVPNAATIFVGRHQELATLEQAFERTRAGLPVVVLVEGESGVGKTALVAHFLTGLRRRYPELLALAGRCFEREAVPYQGFDGVIDALARVLLRLPGEQVAPLLPRNAAVLGRMFPVLSRVPAVAQAPAPRRDVDPTELRLRLFAAVRELCARTADHYPLVLAIDDLQWAGADTLALLTEIVRPPDAAPLLLVATRRTGITGVEPSLPVAMERVALQRLTVADAEALAAALLAAVGESGTAAPRGGTGGEVTAASIAAEAGGHPLFIDELVRHAQSGGGRAHEALRLDDALRARVEGLPELHRRVVELVALAGQPLPQRVLALAAEADPEELVRCVATLRVGHLVRTRGDDATDALSPYHTRVAEAVRDGLTPEARTAHHRQLAQAQEALERPDHQAVARQWQLAGEPVRAATHAVRGAEQAVEALAFDQAAALYRTALELEPEQGSIARELRGALANALAAGGRGGEAAEVYLTLAATARPEEALDLRRRAADQYLRSGRIAEGLAEIRTVLEAMGMSFPATPRRALTSLLMNRARLRLRGLGFTQRHAHDVSRAVLARVDSCLTLGMVLDTLDTIRAQDFNARALLGALRAGEPSRLARALAAEAVYYALSGTSREPKAQRILQLARRVGRETGDPLPMGLVEICTGYLEYFLGRFAGGITHSEAAQELLRQVPGGATWELGQAALVGLFSRYYCGRMAELRRLAPQAAADALGSGDLNHAAHVRLILNNAAWLVDDDIAGARQVAAAAIEGWSREAPTVGVWYTMMAEAQLHLYEGPGRAAYDRVLRTWQPLVRSLLLRAQLCRTEAWHLRGRAALAAAAEVTDAGDLLREVTNAARRIRRERAPYAQPFADLLAAGAVAVRGNLKAALTHAAAATTGFEDAGMKLYAAVARRRTGQLLGGSEGRELVQAAETWMAGEKIKNPAAWSAMLAPGFPGTE